LFGYTIKNGEPVISNTPATDSRSAGLPDWHPSLNSYLGIPLHAGNEFVGMIGIANRVDGYSETMIEELRPLVGATANAIVVNRDHVAREQAEKWTKQLLHQNRELTQRMFQVQEEERRHLARDLHDEVGQLLTAMQMHAHLINKECKTCDKDSLSSVEVINDTAQKLHREIRSIIRQLRPGMLDELGLEYALVEHVDSWNKQQPVTHCILNMEGDISNLRDNLDVTIYRIVQEALTNIAKYAEASQVTITLKREHTDDKQDWLLLTIEDDGKGMDLKQRRQGFGINGMRERIIGIGGEFKLNSSVGKGVQIKASFPINSDVKD
jgi:signal transduction histidine kinase